MNKIRSHIVFVFLILIPYTSHSQTIIQTQDLNFGTIAIRNLTDTVFLRIRDNGSYTANGNTYVVTPPSRGEFSITGGPANTIYTVTTPTSTFLDGPGPQSFFMDRFRVRPASLVTDATGASTFQMTGQVTSTSGDTFADGDYDDTFNITINF